MPNEAIQFDTTQSPQRQGGAPSFLKETILPAVVILVVLVSGIGSGWYFSQRGGSAIGPQAGGTAPGAQVMGSEVGIDDSKTFRDSAQGTLEEGGIDGEGTHHLVRDGGPSQNVYLTSSVVDLDQFTGHKVEVWGETIGAKKAGWLMDVGKLKVLE